MIIWYVKSYHIHNLVTLRRFLLWKFVIFLLKADFRFCLYTDFYTYFYTFMLVRSSQINFNLENIKAFWNFEMLKCHTTNFVQKLILKIKLLKFLLLVRCSLPGNFRFSKITSRSNLEIFSRKSGRLEENLSQNLMLENICEQV